MLALGEKFQIGWTPRLVYSFHSKILFLTIAVKTYAKADIKLDIRYQISF